MSRSRIRLGDFIANEAAHAVHDIRQKLFEEAWFGRAVNGPEMTRHDREALIAAHGEIADLWETALTGKRPDRDRSFSDLWSGHGAKPERDDPDIER
ncbi:MAG: hypothetical protein JOZ13_17370 [Alphaproteobacteria bacterium]|nr:hypothetical protein [Alphaproteobacteria bacterium]